MDYGLAPERPFPAGVDDAAVVYRWLSGTLPLPLPISNQTQKSLKSQKPGKGKGIPQESHGSYSQEYNTEAEDIFGVDHNNLFMAGESSGGMFWDTCGNM